MWRGIWKILQNFWGTKQGLVSRYPIQVRLIIGHSSFVQTLLGYDYNGMNKHHMLHDASYHLHRNQNGPLCDCFLSTSLCSGLPIQQMWLITDWCTARLTYTTGDQAECQPKSKHNCMAHLQSYDKITSYTTVGNFCQKEWYLLCRIHELPPT